jgi:hypothetical protein
MIHHVTLFQTQPHVDEEKLGEMMISARVSLIKIPEVAGVRSGKNVDTKSPWKFFVSIEMDSLERFKAVKSDPIYIKYLADVISPNVTEQFIASYELEPGRSIKYS